MTDAVTEGPAWRDLRDCETLIHSFCFLIDHGRADEVVGLFTDDGIFDRRGVALRGSAQIADAMAKRSPTVVTRHVCSNILLRAESPTRIRGVTYFQFFRRDSAAAAPASAPADLLEAVGEYHDSFEKTAQGWRIAHRVAEPVFQRG